MLKFMVTDQIGRVVASDLQFTNAITILRKQDDDGRQHNIYLADDDCLDETDGCLDVSKARAIVSGDGLIVPFDGSDYVPNDNAPNRVAGIIGPEQLSNLFSEPCPSCDGFGDEDPNNTDGDAICSMCASGSTLADAVLLAIHRAGRLEPTNPLVRLITHYLRGDRIDVYPDHLRSSVKQSA
ncbi:hypothetical protein [Thalassospira sp. CH_XMU1420-2]|uniref:hypothetical protein n=1 Tax=Thalassospira sp. CH_XMU1420-2 TaxID=3107769 RepID=UPI0030083920